MEDILGFGSMYLISNAGAIIIPAMAIVLRKAGLDIPKLVIFLSVIVSFLATNPFIGSTELGYLLLAAALGLVFAKVKRRARLGLNKPKSVLNGHYPPSLCVRRLDK
ncbi:hypothetical protein [Arthrobacter sp. ISL-28]|uniref:hypothetical protein n=1 Tax=Arthrobacter sp. ISL-28 TaxID=2819108 RepID=UPI001BE5AC9D|nr:hypothetical protein [Arthrobacter sp. ISL-28]MBT2519635.1 hypothetical protein [Arthrobacter sp. ISL-28]